MTLDLGCGKQCLGDIGVDIDFSGLPRNGRTVCARGEALPFREGTFSQVSAGVSLPYMHIPLVLKELKRILLPAGIIRISLHPVSFTLGEFRNCRNIRSTLFRLYVLLNGLVFQFTGQLLRFPNGRIESWQSFDAMKRPLEEAGFTDIHRDFSASDFVILACTSS